MSSRQRNLLEAFKHAGEALPAGSPTAGGPFAGPRKASPEEGPSPPPLLSDVDIDVPKPTWREVIDELPAWLPRTLALAAVFVLGLLIGRASVGDAVQAGGQGPETAREPQLGGPSAPAVAASGGPRRILPEDIEFEDSRPLYDPANVYTVALITYQNSPANENVAWATFDWLQGLGYPVFRPAYHVTSEDYIVLLAGAAPSRADLDELLVKIQRQKSKNGKDTPFASAYIDKIEDHIGLWQDE